MCLALDIIALIMLCNFRGWGCCCDYGYYISCICAISRTWLKSPTQVMKIIILTMKPRTLQGHNRSATTCGNHHILWMPRVNKATTCSWYLPPSHVTVVHLVHKSHPPHTDGGLLFRLKKAMSQLKYSQSSISANLSKSLNNYNWGL